MTSGAETRREILTGLYGPAEAEELTGVVESMLRARGSGSASPPLDERDAWLIAYPDHVTAPGEAPLDTLGEFVSGNLRPHLNGVHVLPFHPSSSDSGFSVMDYGAIDPAYGTWGDLAALARSGRLMVDAVINHMSVSGSWFRGFLAGDPKYAGFFRTASPDADLSAVVRPRTHPLLTRFEAATGPVWVWTTFSADQADLDFANPRVLEKVLDVLLAYVATGAGVIRLDAIAFLWKQEGTASIHLPQTHEVIRFLRSCLDEIDPGVVLVTETNVPHDENVSYFGDGSVREAQAVYQFPLAPLVLDAFLSGDARTLARWVASTRLDLPGTTFLNFLGSHDGVGVRPAEGLLDADRVAALVDASLAAGGRVSLRSLPDGANAPYELNSTWFDLMAAGHVGAAALARHEASHAVMLALRGIPLLYFQSLLGASNDQAALARTGENRALNRQRFALADLESALSDPHRRESRTWAALRRMLRMRSASPAFHPDADQTVLPAPPEILAVERSPRSGADARVLVNVSGRTVTAPGLGGSGWADMATGADVESDVTLGPWQSVWLAS